MTMTFITTNPVAVAAIERTLVATASPHAV
jgi:hypothetical protein